MAFTVSVELAAKILHFPTVSVTDPSGWFIHNRVTRLKYLVKEICIFADAGRRPGAKRFVHKSYLGVAKDTRTKSRIGGCPKSPGRYRAKVKRFEPVLIGLERFKSPSQPSIEFE